MILVATASHETFVWCKLGLQNFSPVLSVAETDSLMAGYARLKPKILIVDLGLPGLTGTRGIGRLKLIHSAAKIIVLCAEPSDEVELSLFNAGVSGCSRIDMDPRHLERIVAAVDRGELWIRRALLPRLLGETRAHSLHRTWTGPTRIKNLSYLTQREREIAVLIANGENNKQIARRLTITERTVKSHLTEIFRKLGISDRLNLALQMMGPSSVEYEPSANHASPLPMAADIHVHDAESMRFDV
ncbi:MAG: DNA-binding response regulator [Herminiimonas sp.]|nr:DNA-binding response regulator [Herminiimonas sp.]